MTDTQDEKRRFRRVPFEAEVSVTSGTSRWQAELLDISLKGALVRVDPGACLAPDAAGTLTVELGPEARIVMEFTVAHVAGDTLGIRCEGIDLDSITHLKRLVTLNTGDPEAVDRELAALIDAS